MRNIWNNIFGFVIFVIFVCEVTITLLYRNICVLIEIKFGRQTNNRQNNFFVQKLYGYRYFIVDRNWIYSVYRETKKILFQRKRFFDLSFEHRIPVHSNSILPREWDKNFISFFDNNIPLQKKSYFQFNFE